MKKIIYILLLITLNSTINAQKYPQKDKPFEFKSFDISLNYGSFSSSSFFDMNSNLQTKMEDTTFLMDNVNNTYRHYSYEYNKTIFNLGFAYHFNESLSISAGIPITFNSFEENYIGEIYRKHYPDDPTKKDTTLFIDKELKSSQSKTTVDYFQLGVEYKFFNSSVISSELNIDTRIPLFSETLDLSNNTLQISNPFQIVTGLSLEANLKKVKFDIFTKYYFRGGDYKDLISYGLGFTLASIPNTYLRGYVDFVTNISEIENDANFRYNKPVFNESYIRVGAEFKITFTDYLYTLFCIDLAANGKNTLNQSTFNWKVGILF